MKGTSKKIHDWFERKYGFGELGLFEAIAVASMYVTNIRFAVSSVIISPAGEAKSEIMSDINKMIPDKCIIKKGVVTEYWIIRNLPEEKLDDHLFCVDDLADSLKAMQTRRIAGFLSFLKNIIDGKAEILTAHDNISYNVTKVGVLVNIPKQAMGSVTGELISTTFFDRTIPFQFATEWEQWSKLYLQNKLKQMPFDPVCFEKRSIRMHKRYEPAIVERAKFLMKLKFSGLPRNINLVKAFLCGNALLNGRKAINDDDFAVFDMMKKFIKW